MQCAAFYNDVTEGKCYLRSEEREAWKELGCDWALW